MSPRSSRSQHSRTEMHNLYDAIDSATPDRLRALLKSLSATTPANFAYIQGELMLQPGALKRVWSERNSDGEDAGDDETGSEDSGHERESDYSDGQTNAPASRQRFEICRQCKDEYDVLHNTKKSCVWHDGSLQVDQESDFWADHYESCDGTIDTDEMRKEYPNGFVWECCDEPGDAIGCKSSRHRPDRTKRVRNTSQT